MRYHIYNSSRLYEGHGYSGPSSDGELMETNSIIEALRMWDRLTKRNPGVGWIIRDTKHGDDL
jgi:hypothetical protein